MAPQRVPFILLTTLSALHACFHTDLPYTRIGISNLVIVNPCKTLANVNDVSAKEYEERCYKDTSLPLADSPKPLQPHVHELAVKICPLMRRRNKPQSVITQYVQSISHLLRSPLHSHTLFTEVSLDQGSLQAAVCSSANYSDSPHTRGAKQKMLTRSTLSFLSSMHLAMQRPR